MGITKEVQALIAESLNRDNGINEKIEALIADVKEHPAPVEPGTTNGDNSIYAPSIVSEVHRFLYIGKRTGFYKANGGHFADVGCGGGEILPLLELHGYNPIGFDHDSRLIDHSLERRERIKNKGISMGDYLIIQGDFTTNAPYDEACIEFGEDIDHIFHGLNKKPLIALGRKIAAEAKKGLTLTVYGPGTSEFPILPGLHNHGRKGFGNYSDMAIYTTKH